MGIRRAGCPGWLPHAAGCIAWLAASPGWLPVRPRGLKFHTSKEGPHAFVPGHATIRAGDVTHTHTSSSARPLRTLVHFVHHHFRNRAPVWRARALRALPPPGGSFQIYWPFLRRISSRTAMLDAYKYWLAALAGVGAVVGAVRVEGRRRPHAQVHTHTRTHTALHSYKSYGRTTTAATAVRVRTPLRCPGEKIDLSSSPCRGAQVIV